MDLCRGHTESGSRREEEGMAGGTSGSSKHARRMESAVALAHQPRSGSCSLTGWGRNAGTNPVECIRQLTNYPCTNLPN
jgi:hypothetical protein